MMSLQFMAILSSWTCLSVSVGTRVPSAWDEVPGRDGVRNFDDRINSNHRFNVNGQQTYNNGLERRGFLDSQPANAELGTLYSSLQANALNNFLGNPNQMLVLNQNGHLYMLPQNNQENAAISSETTQYRTELPTLKHPRYSENPRFQNIAQYEKSFNHVPNMPAMLGGILNQQHQKLPLSSIQNEAYDKYYNLPSNVVRITPVSSGNTNLNNYQIVEHSKLGQPSVKYYSEKQKPLIYKEYAQNPSTRYGTQLKPPLQSLQGHVSEDHTFIVSASTLSPIKTDLNQNDQSEKYTTKKEPIFFVTEGYRNVLVQGPNKKKKYEKPQYQNREASKKVIRTEKLEESEVEEDDEEDEQPPRKRKVTKIYRIHGHNQAQGNGAGAYRNLVDSSGEKPRYLKRPEVHSGDDRESGLRNHLITNYRDDRLHEPNDDNDREKLDNDNELEREDDDNDREEEEDDEEKIKNDDKELDTEKDNDIEEADNKDHQKSDKDDTNKDESADSEESEEDDNENEEEEEPEQQMPHSEHADPKTVQTSPNYPGEGVWAKPGIKHRPYVSQHRFLKPQEVEQKPDGYDVFEDLQKYFENQKDQFGRSFGEKIDPSGKAVPYTPNLNTAPVIKSPNAVNPLVVYDPFNESSQKESVQQLPNDPNIQNINDETAEQQPKNIDIYTANEATEENDENEAHIDNTQNFVPVQLYTQVRKSENEEHEPYDPSEHGRLREVIKDSKVQTVYSEEGYEDAAYDHAGHEKKAEEDQGHEQYEREKIKPKDKINSDSDEGQTSKIAVLDYPVEDSLPSDSVYPSLPKENVEETEETPNISNERSKPSNSKNFISTQELKTTQVKDKNNGDIQLEIESEIKVIVQPNNSTKAHKYVKIYPKILREYSRGVPETDESDDESENDEVTKEETLPLLDTTGVSEHTSVVTVATTESYNKSRDIEVDKSTIIDNITDSSTTESASVAKVYVKAFKTEFDKVVSPENPKVTVKELDDDEDSAKISDEFNRIRSVQRKKRSSDSENKDLEIHIDFIDKINHTFAEKKPEKIDVEKYPYYIRSDLNENSPLRYAENMDNIPLKRAGELSFYKMADKLECPDVPQNIEPIPEHVRNADKNAEQSESDEINDEDEEDDEESDEEENEDESVGDQEYPPAPNTPRIQLGDKIDCLKIRYFGENPLDSPFFKEETVGEVKSIFKELDKKSAKLKIDRNLDNAQKTSQRVESIHRANEIFYPKNKRDERIFESEVKDKVYNVLQETARKRNDTENINALPSIIEKEYDNAESINTNIRIIKPIESEKSYKSMNPTAAPLVTLITTPKYTIQLTPENIYDQIRLLDHLPEEDVTEIIETSTKQIKQVIIKKEPKVEKEVSTVKSTIQLKVDQIDGSREPSRRQSKVLKEDRIGKQEQETITPEAEALRRRRLRPRRPIFQIFDVNKFLITTPYSIIRPAHSTVLPKHKVISEVFYKDEIKPNEQLNVFADILNNIKNSTNIETIPLQSSSNFAEPDSVTISSLEEINFAPAPPKIRVKKYQKDSSNHQNLLHRTPSVHNIETTEAHYNARYPESYEEHHRKPHTSTHKNIVNLLSKEPDNFGYIDQNTRSTQKNFYSGEDTNHPNSNPGTKKVLRRRRKPTRGTRTTTSTSTTFRTTTNINVPDQSTPSNHKPYVIDFIEDSLVVGLVPPSKGPYKTIIEDSDVRGTNEAPQKVYKYKTIPPNFVTEPLTGPAAVTELINEDTPSARPMNNYYFLGLKPPLNQRARSYGEFMGNKIGNNNNNIRRRIANVDYGSFGPSRFKREASRAAYSEVSRNRGSQHEGIPKETSPYDDNDDDYVPHRPKNYYYDEKTGKIVYHNKQEPQKDNEDEEEEEYEEIPDTPGIYLETAEDATHPTPKKVTTKPLLATATPPPEGKGLLDFVSKLKNNPSYKVIPDPTTQDPSKSSTPETVTVDPKSTNPPEFLSILSKVKSDSSYKIIEDPKESKSKSRSTTPASEYEEEEEEGDEEEEEENIQNSPGGQSQELSNIQIFDIGEYLPKIKTVSPKTSIDYSKYKTIERPHTRHNLSSRYNSEEQPNSEEAVNVRRPIVMDEKESVDRPMISEERIAHEKEVKIPSEEIITSTTQKIVQFRRGTRPTTQKTTAETVEPTESSVTRRSGNRRRPVPSGFRTTKRPTTTEVTEATEKVQRVYPQDSQTERTSSQTHQPAKRVYRRKPVRIRHTTERLEEDEDSVDKIVRRSLDYEIDDTRNEFEEEFLGT